MRIVHVISEGETAPCGARLLDGIRANWVRRSVFGVGDPTWGCAWCEECLRIVRLARAGR